MHAIHYDVSYLLLRLCYDYAKNLEKTANAHMEARTALLSILNLFRFRMVSRWFKMFKMA